MTKGDYNPSKVDKQVTVTQSYINAQEISKRILSDRVDSLAKEVELQRMELDELRGEY